MLVFSLSPDNLPIFPHVIVGPNAYGSVGAIVKACFALISIKIAALFYLSLYRPRVVVKQRRLVFKGGRCSRMRRRFRTASNLQVSNVCKLGFILQNNGHLDWCRDATR